jgi:predicted dehydrogenase
VAHFCECIRAGKPSLTDGEAGLRVVRILEAATESMNNRGAPVDL